MQYTEIMVRYGELSTKGHNKKSFIDRLGVNVRKALHSFDQVKVHAQRDRLHVELNGADYDSVMKRLKLVFGIQNFSPSIKVEKTFEATAKAAAQMIEEQVDKPITFKVETRRSDHQFAMDTFEMNNKLGGYLLEKFPEKLKVDVHNPDLTLRVEIRLNGIFLSSETIKGAGGLPVGTAGKGMMMMSGGIDSPVAAYLGMKRGVSMEMVHFFSPPYTSPQALAKAKQLTEKLAKYSGSIKFIQVPFAEIQETVKEKVPEGYLMTIQRRMMLRLAAALMIKRHGLAIFNGESLGQVASQTMESMLAINDVTSYPVLRPVLSFDKTEIIKIAQDIDTYELSILPYEDCCTVFTPPSPKTRPNVDRSREYEKRLDIEGLMQRALDGIEITEIHPGDDYLNQNEDVFAELL
ncbi:tRNA uracil 4-sulfurtransferase ThiI [Limosilactobacillus caviae]|uniref:Probable tRNA sulfurtransferase n=1 Tax=Limosilactobacillus caviae TaxID=1769424 RepID=A0ABQ2C4K2_9LACO|nr:tRNA uracil 4-sulfurtransferase ThiI [Limosilactobacillus caviae]MCD7125415.1 tRNA 4-thiouridine(8) synthase ThiI [Limosilactobacillus caviae]MRH46470.1 tRNA 4-thiouridine(8) synthase ThiI [Limosilactobacillus reuteri]GGI63305.1 putative tRNA sulfurtransferase [Limosilactobacillus caviae]